MACVHGGALWREPWARPGAAVSWLSIRGASGVMGVGWEAVPAEVPGGEAPGRDWVLREQIGTFWGAEHRRPRLGSGQWAVCVRIMRRQWAPGPREDNSCDYCWWWWWYHQCFLVNSRALLFAVILFLPDLCAQTCLGNHVLLT